jgi:hypothetical protein
LSITHDDIDFGLQRLKPKRSSGPDQIPAFVLKELGPQLKEVLHYLLNLSIQSGVFPTSWKVSKVTPIHKKGDTCDVKNYRPVAILSAPAKVLEIILHRRMWKSVGCFIVNEQHGFRPTRSTVTNLLCFNTYIEQRLDARKQVDVIYTDFEKAFDRVDHDVLLSKLNYFGFSNRLLQYMSSYLKERKQYVSFKSYNSEHYFTYSGVPQGSNLGPLLFSLFINDIGNAIAGSKYLLYADDLKLFREITDERDVLTLQKDINSLTSWSLKNKLFFSAPKCHVMTFARIRNVTKAEYTMSDLRLARVENVKDLGVTYVTNFSFRPHITDIVDRAYAMLGFVLRNSLHFKNTSTLTVLYESLVRSILESASIIWSPSEKTHIYLLNIEKFQKRFARHLYRLKFGYYPYMFPTLFIYGCLGMTTLQIRRDNYLYRHFYKLLNGIIDNPDILSEIKLYVPDSYHRSRQHKLFYPLVGRTNLIPNSAMGRAISILNELSEHIDLFHMSYREFTSRIEFL